MTWTQALMSGRAPTDRDGMSHRLRAAALIALMALPAWGTAAATEPAPSSVPGSVPPGSVPPGSVPPQTPATLPDGVRGADLAEPAIIALQSEILVLVELDAFDQPLPPALTEIHDNDQSFVVDLTTESLLDWLVDAETDGLAALDAMVKAGIVPTPAMDFTLRPLDPGSMDSLRAGGKIAVPAGEYAAALKNLEQLASEQSFNAGPAGPPSSGPASSVAPASTVTTETVAPASSVAPSETVANSVAPADDPVVTTGNTAEADEGGSSSLIWIIAGAAAAVLLIVAIVLARRGRRRRPAAPAIDPRLDEVLDAGRRVTTCLEPQAVRRAAVREAIGLTAADAAVLFEVGRDGVQAVVQQPTMFVHPGTAGLVDRVASTGQPVRMVGQDAALAAAEPAAMLVTAVAADGRVTGVIAVVRDAQRPFTDVEQDRLSHLAPFIATGLEASSQHSQVTEQSMTDALTNLANRRRLDRDLGDALATRGGTVAFAMVDIDHFKTYNDTHGHPAGDDVLRQVARILQANVRPNDVVYRYGGEEFCILLPDTTAEEASMVAERLRRAVHDAEFPGGTTQPEGRLTVSVGVALAEQPDPVELKSRADGALYDAKRAGRDRVVIAPAADDS